MKLISFHNERNNTVADSDCPPISLFTQHIVGVRVKVQEHESGTVSKNFEILYTAHPQERIAYLSLQILTGLKTKTG